MTDPSTTRADTEVGPHSAPRPPVLTADDAARVVAAFRELPIVIVGDVMLDQFVVGRVNRISPEAPVPVVEFGHEEFRAGGAANVAANVRSLGGRVELVGIVGRDQAGERLVQELEARSIGASGVVCDVDRRTTTKLRIVTDRNQQVARVDYENDDEVTGQTEAALVNNVRRAAVGAKVLVVSDYLKGAISQGVIAALVEITRERGIPVLVDPKIPHIDYYRGTTLVTPNHHEAEVATHLRIRTHADAARAAHVFRERAACDAVLITRGEQGMCLLDREGESHFPAVAREVADVTGAGDTVLATLALALGAGASIAQAAWLANHAAGVVVAKFGPATVTPTELLRALSPEPKA
ncbi:MAG: D-glycero-beta-D-manno-heptose-7-phosphate kinase [Bacteroidales bacterium]